MTLKQKVKKSITKHCDQKSGCVNCPYEHARDDNYGMCIDVLMHDALTVIADLEEKNKKLTRKVKDLKSTVIVLEDILNAQG